MAKNYPSEDEAEVQSPVFEHHHQQAQHFHKMLEKIFQQGERILATQEDLKLRIKAVKDGVSAVGDSLTAEVARASKTFEALRNQIAQGTVDPVVMNEAVSDLATLAGNLQGLKAHLDSFDPASTSIAPNPINLAAGQTVQLVVKDGDGTDITSTCQFASDNPAIASVDGAGVVAFVAAGNCNVTATPPNDPVASILVACS